MVGSGADRRVVPVDGGSCDLGVLSGPSGTTIVDGDGVVVSDDRVRLDLDPVADALSFDEPLSLVGLGLLGTTLASLSWWLACAYRCTVRSDRAHPPSHAWRPVRVVAVAFVVGSLFNGPFLAAGVGTTDAGVLQTVAVIVNVALYLTLLKAQLTVADMIGDVASGMGWGHVPTRFMTVALKASLLFVVIGMGLSAIAFGTPSIIDLARLCSLMAAGASLVAFVAYIVGVAVATVALERTLGDAARQLDATTAA